MRRPPPAARIDESPKIEAAGVTAAEAAHRLTVDGPNELIRQRGASLPGDVAGS